MFHHDLVGHFDPRDGIDYSTRPPTLKPSRPVSREVYERTLARFEGEVAEFVRYCSEGWVVCNWSYAPRRRSRAVWDFAATLAENDCAVVMTEMYVIRFPGWAKQMQEETWQRMTRERNAAQAKAD